MNLGEMGRPGWSCVRVGENGTLGLSGKPWERGLDLRDPLGDSSILPQSVSGLSLNVAPTEHPLSQALYQAWEQEV